MARPGRTLNRGMAALVVKRALLIAYHFPPIKVSSGIQRTLRFAQYLPEFGWESAVLAPHPRAYESTSEEDMASIAHIPVRRAFAFDSARHLAFMGRYPRVLALPDRWVSWWLGAVPEGLMMIRHFKPQLIWSTYPIATAHLIGLTLHRLTGIPWIADLRDPMAQDGYPTDPKTWRAYDRIEKLVVRHATAVTFTTPGTLRDYTQRYPLRAGKFTLIENGYDENVFAAAEAASDRTKPRGEGPFVLLHSGVIYPSERDPRQFFAALARLQAENVISPAVLQVVLRATGHDSYLLELIHAVGLQSIVRVEPAISYIDALTEMLTADALLILQAANCNDQIPAKLYEYLRARRPVLALTDPAGDTAKALAAAGIDTIAALDSEAAIYTALRRFVLLLRGQNAPIACEAAIATASRKGRTAELAQLMNRLVETGQ
jgi:glycosyltransferase involved in cell wall biosynthesis